MPFWDEIPFILVLLVSRLPCIHPLQTLLLLQMFPRQNFASVALSGFQMLWEDLLLKQEARVNFLKLTLNWRQTNRKVDKVLGDGNCLFRSFTKQTTGRSEDHACLRNLLIKFEEINPDIFRPLVSTIDPPTTLENHLKQMKQDSVWGTTIRVSFRILCGGGGGGGNEGL